MIVTHSQKRADARGVVCTAVDSAKGKLQASNLEFFLFKPEDVDRLAVKNHEVNPLNDRFKLRAVHRTYTATFGSILEGATCLALVETKGSHMGGIATTFESGVNGVFSKEPFMDIRTLNASLSSRTIEPFVNGQLFIPTTNNGRLLTSTGESLALFASKFGYILDSIKMEALQEKQSKTTAEQIVQFAVAAIDAIFERARPILIPPEAALLLATRREKIGVALPDATQRGQLQKIVDIARKHAAELEERLLELEARRLLEQERPPEEAAGAFSLSKKKAITAICYTISNAVAQMSNKEHPIDTNDYSRFIEYFRGRILPEDLPLFGALEPYLAGTSTDFAGQRERLFTKSEQKAAIHFLSGFGRAMSELECRFREEAPAGSGMNHLATAARLLENIYYLDILPSLKASDRIQPEEIGKIMAGRISRSSPA